MQKKSLPDAFVLKETSTSSSSLEHNSNAHAHLKFLPIIHKNKTVPPDTGLGSTTTNLFFSTRDPPAPSLLQLSTMPGDSVIHSLAGAAGGIVAMTAT